MDEAVLLGVRGRGRERGKECEVKPNHASSRHYAGQVILDSSAPADIGDDKRINIRRTFLDEIAKKSLALANSTPFEPCRDPRVAEDIFRYACLGPGPIERQPTRD
jgi:hypothetical protein